MFKTDDILHFLQMFIWGAIGALVIVFSYHWFVVNEAVIGVVDVESLYREKVVQLSKKHTDVEKDERQIDLESELFWRDVRSVMKDFSQEHHVVLFQKKAVIQGYDYDFTEAVRREMKKRGVL